MEQLLRAHLAEPGSKCAALNLATTDAEPARAFLKALANDAQQAETRGCAAIALAANLERTSPDDEDDRALRIRMLEFAIRHVGELEVNGKSLKNLAHRQLFAARNLSVGVAPPPLEARDVDGSPFSLKNQRGKVTIVLFSASWCRYSEPLYRHLRNYLRPYGDDAVTVLGVFQDPPSEVSKLRTEGKVAWQSVEQTTPAR